MGCIAGKTRPVAPRTARSAEAEALADAQGGGDGRPVARAVVTVPAVAAKLAEVAPAATVTEVGTVSAVNCWKA